MKTLWPELLVLALFLTGDLFWDGMASAAAGAAAGILAFLILLLFKKRKPGLIVEGFIFGGITALGELVDYPGGTLVLMELVISVILLLSALFGLNIIARLTGDIGKGFFSKRQAKILSVTLGSVLLIHSLLSTAMSFTGVFNWWTAGLLFVLLYIPALGISRTRMNAEVRNSLPALVREQDDVYRLEREEVTLGKIRLTEENGTVLTAEIISVESKPYEFLGQLETAVRGFGQPGLIIEGWSGDEIELEMQGFVQTGEKWRKRLR